jgi:ureidoacrylate peracid hydrolase
MQVLELPARHYRIYPPEKWLGYETETLSLHTCETALMVVDVQGIEITEADLAPGDMPRVYAPDLADRTKEIVVNHIKPAIDAARRVRMPVVYTLNAAPKIELTRSEFGRQRQANCGQTLEAFFAEPDADPHEFATGVSAYGRFCPLVAPQPQDYVIRKHVYSGFYETRMDSLLRNLGVRTLVCVGFATDYCLLGTMLDALYRGYRVILLRDSTMGASEMPEEAPDLAFTNRLVLWVENAIGSTATSEDFVRACAEAAGARA